MMCWRNGVWMIDDGLVSGLSVCGDEKGICDTYQLDSAVHTLKLVYR